MIILITGFVDVGRADGSKALMVRHALDADTMKSVRIKCVPPQEIEGAYYNSDLDEWCIDHATSSN